jgi:polyhydroxyalkanoate synthesis regulator phasin
MGLKQSLVGKGMKLMSDPRVIKLVHNEQFMKALVAALGMPGKIDGFTKEQAERLAKKLSLATADEVRELKRRVRALEDEIAELGREKPRG